MMESNQIAVVTGGSGFVGGSFVRALDQDPTVAEIRILDTVPPNEYLLTEKMRFRRVDVMDLALLIRETQGATEWYDLVGLLGTSDATELGSYPGVALDINVKGFLNQVEAMQINRVERMFHPSKNRFDVREGTAHGLSENWYTATKVMSEIVAFWARRSRGQMITTGRLLNVSGPCQHLGPTRKLFPLSIVCGILDIDFSVYGDGKQLISFIHPDDCARLCIDIMRRDSMQDPVPFIDLGTEASVSVIDLVSKIKARLASESQILFLPMRTGEKSDSRISITQDSIDYIKSTGFQAVYSIDDVIDQYTQHYLRHDQNLTAILNTMIHFEDNYSKFTKSGKEINLRNLGLDYVSSKFQEKKNSSAWSSL